MNVAELFFLTDVAKAGRVRDLLSLNIDLEDLANVFLSSARVLWHGRTVYIVRTLFTGNLEGVHHVASFHREGQRHLCRTNPDFHSSPTDSILTILSVICLIPGLIIGSILKVISHSFEGVRINYQIVKEHLTMTDIEIGTTEVRVTEATKDDAFNQAEKRYTPYHQKINHLIIHGDGRLVVSARGNFLKKILPKKIILDGASLSREDALDPFARLFQTFKEMPERNADAVREVLTGKLLPVLVESGKYECEEGQPKVYPVESVEEALKHTPPQRPNGKRYRAIYQVVASMQ